MVGTDPRTLSSDRLAHLKVFQDYRISWDDLTRSVGRKVSLTTTVSGAESPRPREVWAEAIIKELQALNDKVRELCTAQARPQ